MDNTRPSQAGLSKHAPSMQWNIDMATTLHLLRRDFKCTKETVAVLFWHIHGEEVDEAGYGEDDFDHLVSHLVDHYDDRHVTGRTTVYWKAVEAEDPTPEQQQRCLSRINEIMNIAKDSDIDISKRDLKSNDEERSESDSADEGAQEAIRENIAVASGSRRDAGVVESNVDMNDDDDSSDNEQDNIVVSSPASVKKTRGFDFAKLSDVAGRGIDGVKLYNSDFVNVRPNTIWTHRGGKLWAPGLPNESSFNGKNKNKVHIRIPKTAIVLPDGQQYIKTKEGSNHDYITAEHIDDVFEDRDNVQHLRQPFGRIAHRARGGRGAWSIPGDQDRYEETMEEVDQDKVEGNWVAAPYVGRDCECSEGVRSTFPKIHPSQVWWFSVTEEYARYWGNWVWVPVDDHGVTRYQLDRTVPNPRPPTSLPP